MQKFFAVLLLATLSQVSYAGNGGEGGWTVDPEPYEQPIRGNVWFQCGAIQGMRVQVLNDLTLVFTEASGVSHRLPMRSTGGIFAKDYVTVDGQFVLKARLGNPHITDARGTVLAYCSGGSASSGSDSSGGGTGGNFP